MEMRAEYRGFTVEWLDACRYFRAERNVTPFNCAVVAGTLADIRKRIDEKIRAKTDIQSKAVPVVFVGSSTQDLRAHPTQALVTWVGSKYLHLRIDGQDTPLTVWPDDITLSAMESDEVQAVVKLLEETQVLRMKLRVARNKIPRAKRVDKQLRLLRSRCVKFDQTRNEVR